MVAEFGKMFLDQGDFGQPTGDVHAEQLGKIGDRKSTRLNSSHGYISYAVFCLKKKNSGISLSENVRAWRSMYTCTTKVSAIAKSTAITNTEMLTSFETRCRSRNGMSNADPLMA